MNDQEAIVWAQVYSTVMSVGLSDTTAPTSLLPFLQETSQKLASEAVVAFRKSCQELSNGGSKNLLGDRPDSWEEVK